MQRLCIIAHARTGTNYLCSLLDGFERIRCYKELFHPNAAFGLTEEELALARTKPWRRFHTRESPALVKFARSKPGEFLNMVEAVQQSDIDLFGFKIFPPHLRWEVIENEILSHDNTHYLFVKRNMLDSYISFQKAKKVKKFSFVDTTDIKVDLIPSEFLTFAAENTAWFERWERAIEDRGLTARALTYDTDVTGSDEQTIEVLMGRLSDMGLDFESPQIGAQEYEKQDQGVDYHSKVNNWDQFLDELSIAGVRPPIS